MHKNLVCSYFIHKNNFLCIKRTHRTSTLKYTPLQMHKLRKKQQDEDAVRRAAAIDADEERRLKDKEDKDAPTETDADEDLDEGDEDSEEDLVIQPGGVPSTTHGHVHPSTAFAMDILLHELHHIYDSIARWGPVRSYWAFATERRGAANTNTTLFYA
jgi:hypothetical protein